MEFEKVELLVPKFKGFVFKRIGYIGLFDTGNYYLPMRALLPHQLKRKRKPKKISVYTYDDESGQFCIIYLKQ